MKASRKLLRFIGTMSDQDQESLWKAIKDSGNTTSKLEAILLARRLEDLHEWRLAAVQWESINKDSDANACNFIADSIERGDIIRKEYNG